MSLRAIKVVHTIVWLFFVVCILAIPLFTARAQYSVAGLFAAIVGVEVGILAVNRMRCPLTGVAARYTADRRANFDIYLPEFLARHNKSIFGTLYAAALLYLLVQSLGAW